MGIVISSYCVYLVCSSLVQAAHQVNLWRVINSELGRMAVEIPLCIELLLDLIRSGLLGSRMPSNS